MEADLARIEPALAVALNVPGTSVSASAALGDVPDQNAQRGLADVLIDPGKPRPRYAATAAVQLARCLQRFGPLVAADQEAKLVDAFDNEPDPTAPGHGVKHGASGRLRPTVRPDRRASPSPRPPARTPTRPQTSPRPSPLSRGHATPAEPPRTDPPQPEPVPAPRCSAVMLAGPGRLMGHNR